MASFLRKGKPLCWKQANKDPEFLDIFSRLGVEMHVPAEVFSAMETFACFLYGEKKIEHVNEARSAIFWRKMNKEHKAVDLSLLPPCSSSLRKHVTLANYVARLRRMAQYPIMALEDPQFHGWLSSLNIDWISEAYPDDVAKLVVERDEGSDKESDAPEDSSYSCSSDDDE